MLTDTSVTEVHDFSELALSVLYRPAINTRSLGISRGALGRDKMTKFGDLAIHAQRCEELAEICTDRTIAMKLRTLAVEYREIMKRYPLCGESQSSSADEAP